MRPLDLFFSTLNMERRMDQKTYLPIEMQFYISMMFLGLPDDKHEEKPSFLQLKKTYYRRTDGPTDWRTDRPSYRDARTYLKTGKIDVFPQMKLREGHIKIRACLDVPLNPLLLCWSFAGSLFCHLCILFHPSQSIPMSSWWLIVCQCISIYFSCLLPDCRSVVG